MNNHPLIARRPPLPVGPHLHAEAERAELERLTKLAEPLMDAIPSSLEYRLEALLLKASEIYADRLIKGLS
jgi:hypothetical protein